MKRSGDRSLIKEIDKLKILLITLMDKLFDPCHPERVNLPVILSGVEGCVVHGWIVLSTSSFPNEHVKRIQCYLSRLNKKKMNNFWRTIIAAYGAKKLGGGCISTIIVFIVLFMLLKQCG